MELAAENNKDQIVPGLEPTGHYWFCLAAKLRGRGCGRAGEILGYAKTSAGITDGAEAAALAVKWFVKEIRELDEKLMEIEEMMHEKYREINYANVELEHFESLFKFDGDQRGDDLSKVGVMALRDVVGKKRRDDESGARGLHTGCVSELEVEQYLTKI